MKKAIGAAEAARQKRLAKMRESVVSSTGPAPVTKPYSPPKAMRDVMVRVRAERDKYKSFFGEGVV